MRANYVARTPNSLKLFKKAKKVFAGGVNHNARYYEPYPISVARAGRQHIWDEDGNRYVDYWMGHMALILGHSPRIVTDALSEQLMNGTHYGMGSRLSLELGEEIQKTVPCAERVRFCNTGAEATMYLVRLARGFTGRRTILKMAGGWHGYNTELNVGVHAPFDRAESAGILPEEQAHVKTIRFNDLEAAAKVMRRQGKDVAAILLEPVLGAGGCIPADAEYLKGLRELADKYDSLLAFDEIITGFRVALGGAQERYGVKPDLTTLGKIVGGGLPIGVVCGRSEIMSLADPTGDESKRVSIGGGTFSENPLTMTAGLATVRHLRKDAARIYPGLEAMGKEARQGIDREFAENGVETHTTGLGSLLLTHFGPEPRSADDSVRELKEMHFKYALYLMTKGIFFLPGHPGGISASHERSDIENLIEESGRFAELQSRNDKRKS